MNVKKFEATVRTTEKIRIVIRAPENCVVEDYPYPSAAPRTWTVAELLEKRIQPLVGDLEVYVQKGNGEKARGNTTLRTVEES